MTEDCPEGSVCAAEGICIPACFSNDECFGDEACVDGVCMLGRSNMPGYR